MEPPEYKPGPDVIVREEEDGAFLFDASTGTLKFANETALELWREIKKGLGRTALLAYLEDQYEGSGLEEMMRDLDLFLSDMVRNGFLSGPDPLDVHD